MTPHEKGSATRAAESDSQWGDAAGLDRDRLTGLVSVLSEFASTVLTDFSLQEILDHLVERVVELLPITAAGVTLISSDLAPHQVAASSEDALRFERLQTELGQGPCVAAYASAELVAVPDLAGADGFPAFGPAAVEAGMAAVFAFPLRHRGGCLGALDLYRSTPGALAPEDLTVAQTLADVTTSYLLNAQIREQALLAAERFRDSALHDPLTGLANRVLLEERLDQAASRASRSGKTTAVLFVDLDRFKLINDTYGHALGDVVLAAVAARLSTLVRPGDTLARASGDEFVFLCEDLDHASDVGLLAARIETAFAEPFELAELVLTVGASVGAGFSGPGEAVTNQLLLDADAAMYQAKRRTGSQTVIDQVRPAKTPAVPGRHVPRPRHAEQDGDAALVRAAQRGDERAWERRVDRYVQTVWDICRSSALTREDEMAISHLVWLRLAQSLDRVDPAHVCQWLTLLTTRECELATLKERLNAAGMDGARVD